MQYLCAHVAQRLISETFSYARSIGITKTLNTDKKWDVEQLHVEARVPKNAELQPLIGQSAVESQMVGERQSVLGRQWTLKSSSPRGETLSTGCK